ncbi:unnamed protein product [Cyprideis torosa]|uniref:Sterol carrier protein 2 n=1 Tax=Cyprideis torosa TaxID=163714 RepID=A0A7R8ZGK1_9CRUS|nr:unnamed protein product [Cyprideis torosa]CAG0881826.1 unnamed protein product [Cyprideis torosa]
MVAQKPKKAYVVGVGMTKFEKPGRRADFDYPEMAKEATTKALEDAGIQYTEVEQACVGYVYGDSTCGQRALYALGMTGIPVFNVNNNCATGSTALFMAKQLVVGGQTDCVLALGFEKMQRGSLSSQFSDRANPMERHVELMIEVAGLEASPVTAQMFGNAAREHMKKYGTTEEHLAKIAYKNHLHSVNNPNSQFQEMYTLDQIRSSPMVHFPLTKLQCCPTSDGAAACVVVSGEFVLSRGLQNRAVEIVGMMMSTDKESTFKDKSMMKMVGYDMTKDAVDRLYQETGIHPREAQVVELHDCFSANELITYEALGLCAEGEAKKLIDSGNNTYGGTYVINPSGGLISKGHPLGATGLAQCAELVWQLRGEAGKRQVPGAHLALQHNIGLGGAVIVALYRRMGKGDGSQSAFKSEVIFNEIQNALQEDPSLVKKVKGTFLFKVTKGPGGAEGNWFVDAKTSGKVKKGVTDKADVTLTMTDSDLFDLMSGKLNPQQAFYQGKLKIQGNLGLAMKMQEFQKKAEQKIAGMKAKL